MTLPHGSYPWTRTSKNHEQLRFLAVFCTKIVYKLSFNQIKIKNKPCVTWGFGSKDDNRNSESFTGYSLSPKLIIESKPVEEIHDFWSSDNDDNTRTSILGLILTIGLSWLRQKHQEQKICWCSTSYSQKNNNYILSWFWKRV